jgi:hypothetical protein
MGVVVDAAACPAGRSNGASRFRQGFYTRELDEVPVPGFSPLVPKI